MEQRLLEVKLPRNNSLGEMGVARSLSARVLGRSTDQDHSPPLRFSRSPVLSPLRALRCKYYSRRVSSARASQKRCFSEQQVSKTRRLAPPGTPRRQSMFDFRMRTNLAVIFSRVTSIKNTFKFRKEEFNFEQKKQKLQVHI